MRHLLLRSLLLLIALVFLGSVALGSDLRAVRNKVKDRSEPLVANVLGVADSIENMFFKVAIPATFEDTVTFKKPISAPDLIQSLIEGTGITVGTTDKENPVISLSLESGSGITVDGNKISNSGILSLSAGSGITVDGNKISNSGILSLSAGTNISIDGNKITNTMASPDYTQSGWTTGTGKVYLTTLTDSVGIGTTTPSSTLHVVGSSNLSGDVTLGTSSSDNINILGSISAGSTILPSVDLGADIGSSLYRFNNLWVANINSNSSQAFSGQTTFSYPPTDTTIAQASVLINPTTSVANGQLLGFSLAGYQRALIDAEGDLILGYNSLTSAPANSYPLSIFGHSGTEVGHVDTSGNLNLAGSISLNSASVLTGTTLGSGVVNSSLTSTGALNGGSITSGFGSIDTGADSITTTGTIGTAGTTSFTGNSLAINTITSTGNLSILPTSNVGIGTTNPTSTLSVLGDIASSVATGTEAIKLSDLTGITKLAMKYTSTGSTLDTPGSSTLNKLTNGTFETDITTGGWNSYSLNDQFTTAKTPAELDADTTTAEPTGGVRTVTDTTDKLSIAGGQLSYSGSTLAWGNPGLWYPTTTRATGLVGLGSFNISAFTTNSAWAFGFGSSQTSIPTAHTIYASSTGLKVYQSGIDQVIGSWSTGTTYTTAIVLRSTGAYFFVKGGAYTSWTLMFVTNAINTSSLYLGSTNYDTNSVLTADNIRIPTTTWLPTPLAYDTFTTAGATSTETTGPDSQTTPSLAWTGGTKASGTMSITPTLGSELVTNPDLESPYVSGVATGWAKYGNSTPTEETSIVQSGSSSQKMVTTTAEGVKTNNISLTRDTWYSGYAWFYPASVYQAVYFRMYDNTSYFFNANGYTAPNAWVKYVSTGRSVATLSTFIQMINGGAGTFYGDNVSFKPLTLSSLFSTVSTSDADVIADANVTLTAGTQAGLVLNLDSTSSPANFILVYHNGTQVIVDQAVAGVYTNKQTTTVTYSAGATLRAIREGTKLRVYYNNALVGSELTMTANTNTKHGLFSTYASNTFDNFTLFARGTGSEYEGLMPDTDLTATRDTTTYYSGSSSLKLVASTSDNGYTQAVTLPDTTNYTLSAYAYTTGAAVTSADVSLIYDGDANLTTTYTSVGNGWYHLTSSFAGVASSRNYGVKVKAGKTVYIDNLSLYSTSSTSVSTLAVTNSTTGLGGMSVESTTTLNSGLPNLQALIVRGSLSQSANLQEWQDSTGTVLSAIDALGGLSMSRSTDSTTAYNFKNSAGTSVLNIDTTNGFVGLGSTAPSAKLEIVDTSNTASSLKITNNTATTLAGVASITANALTSGTGFSLTSSSTALTGDLASITASGSNSAVTGNVLKVGLTGSSSTGTALNVTTAGASGFGLRVNDDGTYTDSSPFVVDSSGQVGIGTTAPSVKLDLAGTSGIDAFRLTSSGSKVLGMSYATNQVSLTTASTDPTNKLLNNGFESDLTSWSEVPSYTLNDQFTTDRAAGAVNGTSAEPTGGTRTVTDTTSKLLITGGNLSFSGGIGSGSNFDPGIYYSGISRVAGKVLTDSFTSSDFTKSNFPLALGRSATINFYGYANLAHGFFATNNNGIFASGNAASGPAMTPSLVNGTTYQLAFVLRSTGAYYYIKGGVYTNWTLLWISALDNTATLYPAISNYDGTFTADNIRIPTSTWLPTPLAYDTFTRADGAISSSETSGPDSQTTPSLAWTGGAISTNKNVITPTLGSELITNGDMEGGSPPTSWTLVNTSLTQVLDERTGGAGNYSIEITNTDNLYGAAYPPGLTGGTNEWMTDIPVGKWYTTQAWMKKVDASQAQIDTQSNTLSSSSTSWTFKIASTRRSVVNNPFAFRTGGNISGTKSRYDDVSVKPLTLSSLFSTVSTSDADVIADANVTLTSGTQAGLVLNLDSTSSPANFIIVYHDGTSVKVDEAVAGVYTNKQTTTVTYSAGATLRAIREGTKLRVYYNNVMVGSELTMTANTNTKHGLFSTYSGNSFDNFTLWPRGSGTTKFTDAPFEELVATRNTTTTYNNSTASVQLVTSGTDANYLQSVNVGDTSTYNLIAYAYTDGSAVTSSDLALYYDTAVLSTTYTPMGGTGWYKLTGTLTGVASAKDYGVRVKAGKTVYVDDLHLQVGTGTTQTMYVMNTGTGVTDLSVQGLVNGTLNGVATFTKAGTISDSDFSNPTNGLMGFDSTNGRLYVRNGGAWSYIAKTAGFQIPDYESVGLSPGDFLIPYVEKKMEDGAVHGLYAKWSEVKSELLSSITDLFESWKSSFTTKELCLKDSTEEVCIDRDRLKIILDNIASPSPTPLPSLVPLLDSTQSGGLAP